MPASLLLLELETKSLAPKGDCTIPGFEGHIVLESFRWTISASTPEKVGGKPVPRVIKPGKVTLSKPYDRSSTGIAKLMERSTKDPHFLRATLKFVDPHSHSGNSNAKLETIMTLELTDGFVEEISLKASESDKSIAVSEDITLSFDTCISISYNTPSAGGKTQASPEFLYMLPAA